MDFLYINLEGRADRRASLEKNFQDINSRQWRIHRIDAVDVNFVVSNRVEGRLREAEKACFVSHIRAVEKAKECSGPVMIAEDDIWFGKNSSRRDRECAWRHCG